MAMALLAQGIGGIGLMQMIIIAIVIAGALAILFVALKHFGIAIPPWAVSIFWIVIVVFVSVIAVKFLWSLL